MRFRLVHKLTSYLLAGIALATLATSETASWLSLVVITVAAILSWFVEPDTRLGTLFDRAVPLLNVVTVALFALAVLQVARSFPDVDLSPFLDFVLFLLGYKLCQRRGNRDYLQIYILSFLVMLAAAWQATSAVFIVGFFLYVLLATWTLILFHLRREIEENYLVRHAGDASEARVTVTRVLNSRRVVGWPFFLATGRWPCWCSPEPAWCSPASRAWDWGLSWAACADRRAWRDSPTRSSWACMVCCHSTTRPWCCALRFPASPIVCNDDARENEIASLYWRGTVYDTYENGEWIRSRDERTRTQLTLYHSPSNDGRTYVLSSPQTPGPPPGRKAAISGAIEQDIEVVALVNAVAFALDHPAAVELPPPPTGAFTAVDVEPRWSGELGLRAFRISPFDRSRSPWRHARVLRSAVPRLLARAGTTLRRRPAGKPTGAWRTGAVLAHGSVAFAAGAGAGCAADARQA